MLLTLPETLLHCLTRKGVVSSLTSEVGTGGGTSARAERGVSAMLAAKLNETSL